MGIHLCGVVSTNLQQAYNARLYPPPLSCTVKVATSLESHKDYQNREKCVGYVPGWACSSITLTPNKSIDYFSTCSQTHLCQLSR